MIYWTTLLLSLCPLAWCIASEKQDAQNLASGGTWQLHEMGKASWYGTGHNGCKLANGCRYNEKDMTAAHKKLPFGTHVKVTNLKNGRSCVVQVNDRGPFVKGRVIDLSEAAAKIIGVESAGIAPVKLELIQDVTESAHKLRRPGL